MDDNLVNVEDKKEKLKKKTKQRLIILAFLCVAAIFGYSYFTNYRRTVEKFLKAIETQNAKLYGSLVATGWKNSMIKWWSYDDNDFMDDYEDTVDTYFYEFVESCGDDISSTYKITDTYRPTKKELRQLVNELESDYEYEEGSVTGAMLVSLIWNIEGEEGESNVTVTDMLLVKEKGRWKTVRGSISTDWCER